MRDLIEIIKNITTENTTTITYNGVKIRFKKTGEINPIDVDVLVNDEYSAKLYKRLRRFFFNASVNKIK